MKSIFHFSLLLLLSAVAVRAALIPVPSPIDRCSTVLCLRAECEPGQILQTPEGECCPKCVPDCSAVLCLRPVCEPGQILQTPEGECCPKCVPDCSAVSCIKPVCEPGQILQTPEGECCPICHQDCRVVRCGRPICEEGEELFTPRGRCCPICRRPEEPDECPIKGQTFSPCARCDSTCNEIINGNPRRCIAVCRPGCSCPAGQSIDTVNGVCVDTDKCPKVDPCASKTCPRGSSCEVFRPTGEAFCQPSCDIDNGGCTVDQSCELVPVICVRAPCPPEVRCNPRDLCANKSCANGFRCKVFTPILFGDEFNDGPQAFCDPDCSLNNGGCPPDKQCQLLPTPCAFNTPCPHARLCVDPPTESPTDSQTCPPTCSKEFCSMRGNRRALCSNPGPRELPGCTGSCQLSYCNACYFSEEPISPTPGNCTECEPSEYASNTRCYRRWARCVGKAHNQAFGRPSSDDRTEENFRCYRPPCPFKG